VSSTGPDRVQSRSSASISESAVTIGASDAALVAGNSARVELFLQNDHASQDIYLSFGGTAQVNKGIRLKAGLGIVITSYTGAVRAIASGAGTVVLIVEV